MTWHWRHMTLSMTSYWHVIVYDITLTCHCLRHDNDMTLSVTLPHLLIRTSVGKKVLSLNASKVVNYHPSVLWEGRNKSLIGWGWCPSMSTASGRALTSSTSIRWLGWSRRQGIWHHLQSQQEPKRLIYKYYPRQMISYVMKTRVLKLLSDHLNLD